ncbi:ABC transporter substrate-binding protein [Mycolicibacterium holsaticum]|uniref:ABC transporter substrate-binding protein n=1 Tax=Mycolicibacterium holsaticum TaxID=152142 RepID=UPI001C7D921A|nr:ABC transporter substrate-binding protein [Mycolicibacterium holsaticum]MDA4109459.1 ABC transporter substrate-binding protein [Mycolicibacterium holsaticum DSM 44478 = JCM 12374]QZA10399.1 ABC transporter substrate-binding protein [Mycolicibacterium holsaticum DSM 44478 = JCM 12374]UNC12096.1 ABC transporter substrate-binding protein [Mycolicibacterium holsaticum DSM 44478 = JCM 12374]
MRSVRRIAVAITIAVLASTAVLSGCTPGRSGNNPALTVGWVVDPCWAQVPVARDLGYFTDAGVDVEIIPFPTGAAALEALAGGAVDVATGSDVPASAAAIKNPDLRIIADGSRWDAGRFVARGSAGIGSIADLAGRQIAVPLGSSAHFFATKFLSEAGVTAELVQTGPAEIVTAISNRSVDAIAVFQPPLAKAVAALGDDAVELQGPDKYNQHSLYLATRNAVETKPAELTAFLAAVRRADRPLGDADQSALSAVAAATGLDDDLITRVADEFVFRTEIGPDLAGDLADRARWAQGIGRVPADAVIPDYQTLIVPGFLTATGDE